MATFKLASILLTVVVAVKSGSAPRPAWNLGQIMLPPMGSGTLGLGLGGWPAPTPAPGWSDTTTVPPSPETTTTPGWSPPPETTTTPGWSPPPPETTTTPGWSPLPETTTTPGWSPPPETTPGWSGWTPPVPSGWTPGWSGSGPVVIAMEGESGVAGAGEAGATHGSQTTITGDATNPAVASIQTGSYSNLGQGSSIVQISNIGPGWGESSTYHGIDGYNYGDAGEYQAVSASGNTIDTASGGASFVVGQGAIGQGGLTENSSGVKKQ